MNTLDMDARYTIAGWSDGIAWYLLGYEKIKDQDYEWSGIEYENRKRVQAVMVGDDRIFIVDVDDLTPLADGDYCSVCGQVGCTADSRC